MLFVQLILQVCLATVNAQLKEGGAMGAVGGGEFGWWLVFKSREWRTFITIVTNNAFMQQDTCPECLSISSP